MHIYYFVGCHFHGIGVHRLHLVHLVVVVVVVVVGVHSSYNTYVVRILGDFRF